VSSLEEELRLQLLAAGLAPVAQTR